jgi:hypothetical protein
VNYESQNCSRREQNQTFYDTVIIKSFEYKYKFLDDIFYMGDSRPKISHKTNNKTNEERFAQNSGHCASKNVHSKAPRHVLTPP